MQKKWLLIAGIVLVLLGVGGFLLRDKLKPSQAGIQIETNPPSSVYINGEQVGTTPYDVVREPGDITLRLVPSVSDRNLSPWDTKLVLAEGIKTIVRRDFGETDDLSAGEVLSFEKLSSNEAELAVVSSPDAVQVSLDGEVKGYTPLAISNINIGEHKIKLNQPGFLERELSARTEAGYKLTVIAKLAQLPQEEASESGEITDDEEAPVEEMVEIQDTPVGYLRVRDKASTGGAEVAQVKPGKKFVLLETSKDGDWYKIEYEKGKTGWISAQYAKKVEKEE
ncbi:MAG: PEGA domain-containing protein [bacterium]|nr:PEGA domain-containing protein [bacterium]